MLIEAISTWYSGPLGSKSNGLNGLDLSPRQESMLLDEVAATDTLVSVFIYATFTT